MLAAVLVSPADRLVRGVLCLIVVDDVEQTASLSRLLLPGPLRKPLHEPLLFEEGPAPETPRKPARLAPNACLTTLP
ncbi:MAG: hypothetical protein LC777_12710, partial [Actinobacteria bacterium]|nr:hypothetical protein [Actinomycetota bacterium]